MKIAILDHIDHGKSVLSEAIIEHLKDTSSQVQIVQLDDKDCFDRGVIFTKAIKDDSMFILNNEERLNMFVPPKTRAERRKEKRKNK